MANDYFEILKENHSLKEQLEKKKFTLEEVRVIAEEAYLKGQSSGDVWNKTGVQFCFTDWFEETYNNDTLPSKDN